jgi:hypothetical protein
MMKKSYREFLACLAILGGGTFCTSAICLAAEPSPNAQALGISEGILSYCARVDAPTAAKLQARVKALAQGASEETLAKIRNSDEYRQGYDSATDFVSKVDPHNAARPCTEALAAGK